MKIFEWNEIKNALDSDFFHPFFKNGSGISVGSFDGLHQGHRLLLKTLVKNSRAKNLLPGIVTFLRPLPSIKHSSDYDGDLTTLDSRLKLFESLGLEFVILVDFTLDFASLKGIEFLQMLIDACNMKYIAEGVDFRCGYKGSTDATSIKYFAENNNIFYDFVESVFFTNAAGENERISSSIIRSLIKKRLFSLASELLCRPYSIFLTVENHFKNSSTQKIIFEKNSILQVLPPTGIYKISIYIEEKKFENVRLEITEKNLLLDFNFLENESENYKNSLLESLKEKKSFDNLTIEF